MPLGPVRYTNDEIKIKIKRKQSVLSSSTTTMSKSVAVTVVSAIPPATTGIEAPDSTEVNYLLGVRSYEYPDVHHEISLVT